MSFQTITNGGPPDGDQRFLAVLLSFILAWLTFRFVERPVRAGNRDRKLVTGGLVAGIAAMAVLGLNVGSFQTTVRVGDPMVFFTAPVVRSTVLPTAGALPVLASTFRPPDRATSKTFSL